MRRPESTIIKITQDSSTPEKDVDDFIIEEGEPDQNGGRVFKITYISCDKEGAKTIGTISFYVLGAAYSIFLSSLFGFLSMLRNKINHTMGDIDFSGSWLANVLSSFYFIINLPGVFIKVQDKKGEYRTPYRVCAGIGIFLGSFNTLAGLKLGMDAIFLSPYEDVRKLGWAAVGVFSLNTFASRSIGSTTALFKLQSFIMQIVKREWLTFEPLFTLLEDLNRYGPTLSKTNFSYKGSENRSITGLAQQFYAALKRKGVKPIPKTGEVLLKAYELIMTPIALYFALTLFPMWTYLSAAGLNASGKYLFDSALGDDLVFVDLIAALASQLLYFRYAALAAEFTIDTVSLPLRATMYYQGKKDPENQPLLGSGRNSKLCSLNKALGIGLVSTVFALGIGTIGWFSGPGMYVEATGAVIENYGNLTNSVLFEIIRAPVRPTESYLGTIAQIYAGEIVNMGVTLLGVGKRFFYTGTKIHQDDDRGINDFIDWVTRALDTRIYLGLDETRQAQNLNTIHEARQAWAGAPNFSWCSLFNTRRNNNSSLPLNQDKEPSNSDEVPEYDPSSTDGEFNFQ